MQRWRGLDSTPSGWGRSVVTIGVFDGVHRGHQQIIGRAVELARTGGWASVVLTFDPHPSEVVRPGSHPPILTTQRTKADLVEALGVDVFCVVPFTPEFSRLAPDEFVHEVLVTSLHAAGVVVGDNFRYGRKAAGDVESLTRAGRNFGFTVEGVPLIEERLGPDQPGTTFSSTYIRSCIAGGDVAAAARALGRPHRVEGVVVRGDGRGAGIGYPTANLAAIAHAAIPADGVYAGRLLRGSASLPLAISIGTNPTFEGQERRVEGYVLDFDGNLYGEHVTFEFVERLRATERYDGVEALVEQMARDVEETRRLTS